MLTLIDNSVFFKTNDYFSEKKKSLTSAESFRVLLNDRRSNRSLVPGFSNKTPFVKAGDFLEVFYLLNGNSISFQGLCLAVRRKNFFSPEVTLVLRNCIQGIWIECVCSYFYNRVYSLNFLDFKRKALLSSRSKWYFLVNLSVGGLKDDDFKAKKFAKIVFYTSRAYERW